MIDLSEMRVKPTSLIGFQLLNENAIRDLFPKHGKTGVKSLIRK